MRQLRVMNSVYWECSQLLFKLDYKPEQTADALKQTTIEKTGKSFIYTSPALTYIGGLTS